jgi:hypothetical protein
MKPWFRKMEFDGFDMTHVGIQAVTDMTNEPMSSFVTTRSFQVLLLDTLKPTAVVTE